VKEISSNLSFNYPGLRIETLSIDKKDIDEEDTVIVCFGDSVTFGWNLQYKKSYPYILQEELGKINKKVIVVNAGIGGDTVLDALERVEKDVIGYKPDLVLTSFGLNDGMLMQKDIINDEKNLSFNENDETFYTRLSLESFSSTYSEVIDMLDKNSINTVMLTTNPVMISFPEGRTQEYRQNQKDIYDKYNDEIRELADNKDLKLIDVIKAFENTGNIEDLIQPDGLHPNENGLRIIAEIITDDSFIIEMIDK
jgi:lysophospholipase L1-like esterase